MYRRAIRSLFVATTALLLLATAACDKPEDKKTADKKAEEVKAPEVEPAPPVEPPPVEPPVEPPPVEPPADTGAVAADTAAAAADAGEPAADEGGEKDDGGEKPPAEKPPAEKSEPVAAKIDGKPIFEAKCKSCHGADGKGETTIGKKVGIPSLAGTKLSKSKIISTTESGVADTKMKGFKDKLSADEIDAVATYVKKL
jgi:mono/diheme cytochrome c family protein